MSHGLPYSLRGRDKLLNKNAFHKLTLPVVNKTLAITDPGAATAFGGITLGAFPEGDILLFGAISYMQFARVGTNLIATWGGGATAYSVGTTVSADATLTATSDANIIDSSLASLAAATAGVSPYTKGQSLATTFLGPVLLPTGTTTPVPICLNLIVADTSIGGADSVICNGVIHIAYCHLGDDNH